jgi:hypothetical protein
MSESVETEPAEVIDAADDNGERGRNRIRSETANKELNRAQLAFLSNASSWRATN